MKNTDKKTNNRRKHTKKDTLSLISSLALCLVIITVMIVMIIDTEKKGKKDNTASQNGSSETTYNEKQVEEAVVDPEQIKIYNEGLTDGGAIAGIDNIADYVTLPSIDSLSINTKDFDKEVEHGQIIHREDYVMGEYLLNQVFYNSKVKNYEPYVKVTNNIINFILEHDYKQYTHYYEQADKQTWKDIYDFMKVNEQQYNYFVDSKTREQYAFYMVVEALRREYNITVDENEMIKYLIESEVDVKDETDARVMIKQLGTNYVAQHAIAWKAKYVLYEKVQKNDKSRNDSIKDYKETFAGIFYDNGKLKEIGETKNYITLPDNFKDLLAKEWNESTFNEIKNAVTYVADNEALDKLIKAIPEDVLKDTGINVDDYFKEQLLIQILADRMELAVNNYEYDYMLANEYDNEDVNIIKAKYGVPYYNRELMKFAVYSEFGIAK